MYLSASHAYIITHIHIHIRAICGSLTFICGGLRWFGGVGYCNLILTFFNIFGLVGFLNCSYVCLITN